MPKSTKIIATLGPASESVESIERLIKAGMNVARLNFSHGSNKKFVQLINNIREAEKKTGKKVAILQDLQGPRIRVGKMAEGGIEVKEGEKVIVIPDRTHGAKRSAFPFQPNEEAISRSEHFGSGISKKDTQSEIASSAAIRPPRNDSTSQRFLIGSTSFPVRNDNMHDIKKGDRIFIDNGSIEIRIIQKFSNKNDSKNHTLLGKVIRGGTIFENKGINLPDSTVNLPTLTGKDKKDIIFGLKHDVDFIALSFVKNKKDIEELRNFIKNHNRKKGLTKDTLKNTPKKDTQQNSLPAIVAKIERKEAVQNFDQILHAADGIMIARGDLGIEISLAEVPKLQKIFIQKCLTSAKPVIVATQIMESMIENPYPTRAEVSDLANAILDGTDAVMLSGETAIGKHPIQAVKIMSDIAASFDPTLKKLPPETLMHKKNDIGEITNAISLATYRMAETLKVKAIICATRSGFTARALSRLKPNTPLYAATPSEKTFRQLLISWDVEPMLIPETKNPSDLISKITATLKKEKKLKTGDIILVAVGFANRYKRGETNLIKVHTI